MANRSTPTPLVGVVMGSKSDWETMRHAAEVLAELGIPHEAKVVSAHRTPERLFRYGREAEGRGLEVIIAGAGGAAHLPGMLAAITILPVLGVPVESKVLRGVDSLLSIVQMPRGVPVGTLAIGAAGAANAGLLAAAILARKYPAIREALARYPRGPDRRRGRIARMSARIHRHRTRDRTSESRRPVVHPPASLGVIGSGQLGRMFVQAAQRMGYRAGVLSDRERRPPRRSAHWTVDRPARPPARPRDVRRPGRGRHRRVRERLGPGAPLAGAAAARPAGLADGLGQPEPAPREDASSPGTAFPSPPGGRSGPTAELDAAVRDLGLPLILKTAASGYDGKGQVRVDSAAEAATRPGSSLGRVAVRGRGLGRVRRRGLGRRRPRATTASAVAYPVGLNRHERHILDSHRHARPGRADRRAGGPRRWPWPWPRRWGRSASLTVEFFLTAEGRLLVNEIAPRPHNSGHLTIEAAVTSQFEQQVRALCGLPLGATDLVMPAAMVNLLGDLWADGEPRWDAALRRDPGRQAPPLRQADARRRAGRWAT